jgi:hypothetical protein
MRAAQMIREIRCGQLQDLVDETHAREYRTSARSRSQRLGGTFAQLPIEAL